MYLRTAIIITLLVNAAVATAQTQATQVPTEPAPAPAYQPKFAGDPAHSDAEAAALGYMRTVVNAQKIYFKRHQAYTTTLHQLVGQGSFTRRMENPSRGDYTAHFRSTGKQYSLSLVPRQYDASHRAFYVDDTGELRAEADQPATRNSPLLK